MKAKVGKGKVSKSKAKGSKMNPWMSHLKKVRAKNKGLSLKEAMKKAKASYKK